MRQINCNRLVIKNHDFGKGSQDNNNPNKIQNIHIHGSTSRGDIHQVLKHNGKN